MIWDLEKITDRVYLLRGYLKLKISTFSGSVMVVNHLNGDFEPIGWSPQLKTGTGVPIGYQIEAMLFLYNELPKIDPDFKRLVGSFEYKKIFLFKRLFKKYFTLKMNYIYKKLINGVWVYLLYVTFCKK